jgi:phage host-nuclease inhibitor protein Gam
MAAARQIIRADLRRTGGQNQRQIIDGISKRLGIERTIVEHIWAAEAKQNGLGQFAIRQKGNLTWSQRAAEIKKYGTPMVLEWFHFKGELPQAIFDLNQRRQGEINKYTSRAESQIADLRKAIKAVYGKETDTVLQHINNVLAGEADILTLPLKMRPAVRNLRGTVNELSRALLESGAIKGDTVLTVLRNMGVEVTAAGEVEVQQVSDILSKPPYERSATEQQMAEAFIDRYQKKFGNYLTRSYAMYSHKNWQRKINRDPLLINRAKRYLTQQLQRKIAEIKSRTTDKIDRLNREIKDITDALQQEANTLNQSGMTASAQAVQDLIDVDAARLMNMAADDLKALDEFWKATGQVPRPEIMAIRDKRERITSIEKMMQDNAALSPEFVQSLMDRVRNVDSEIESILTVDDAPEAWIKRGKLGSKDMRILQKRGQIPGVIRELMGEYRDPMVNSFKSVFRMVNLVANQTFLNDLRAKYEGTLFFHPDKPRPAGAFVQISSEGSRTLAPLNGWYTTPEIKRAMERYYDKFERAPWERWWVSNVVYLVKANLTSLNPVGITRNFWSNVVSMAANGWNPAHTFTLARDLASGKLDRQKVRERMYELQVLGESVNANEVSEYIQGLEDRWPWIRDNILTKPLYMFSDGMKFLYEWGDLIFRVTGFETEKRQAAKQMFAKRFDQLNDQERDEVERRAAKMVNHLSPTYSYVPKFARRVRANPLVGTFISWPAEQVRVTWNQVALSMEELRDSKRAGRGALRLGSLMAAHSLGIAAMLLSRHLVGVDDDEDKARVELGNPFDKDAIVMYLPSQKEGQVKYVNLSYMYPYAWYQKPFLSGIMTSSQDGPGLLSRIGRTAWGFIEPYGSWDVAFLSSLQLATNLDFTRKENIRNELLPWYNRYNVEKTVEFAQKAMGPGFINSYKKFKMAINGEYDDYGNLQSLHDVLFEHLLGVKVRSFDPMISFEQKLKRWADQKQSGAQIYTRAASRADNSYNRLAKSGASDAELSAYKDQMTRQLQNNKDISNVAYQEAMRRLKEIFDAAVAVAPGATAEERQTNAMKIASKYTTNEELVALIQNLPLNYDPKHKKGSIFR